MIDYTFYERQLVQRLLAQDKVISKRFAELINSASPLLAKWKSTSAKDVWIRNKTIEKNLDKLLKSFSTDLEAWINSEQAAAWGLSNTKNDELVSAFTNGLSLNNQVLLGMNARNLDALKAFQKRKIDGMGLSEKVWNLSAQTKTQLEFYLESGISVGRSANEISKDIRQLLNDPEKVFHRVRNEDGKLGPSKPMKDYHPGQGVYRSSYKNALRLAATETNMAYRMSDHERWQGLDFVTGYEVKLSGSHPRHDICDSMKGEYPKSFVFRGWHPGCLCYAVPILMSQDDFLNSLDDDSGVVVNQVKSIPSDAKKYVTDNWDRFADYKNQPYWIRDNFKDGKPNFKPVKTTKSTKIENTKPTLFTPAKTTKEAINSKNSNGIQIDIATKDIKSSHAVIEKVESEIRQNKDFETAVVVGDDGKILIDKRGKSSSVSFTPLEFMVMRNETITHNHPGGWGHPENSMMRIGNSFSKEDILLAFEANVKEMRAVTPNYTFSMKRPEAGWPVDSKEAKKIMNKIDNEIWEDLSGRIKQKTTTPVKAVVTHHHKLWTRFAKELKLEYSKHKTI